MDFFATLKDTPIPTLLVIGGFVFLFLGIATIKKPIVIEVTPSSRKVALFLGIGLIGIGLYVLSLSGSSQALAAETPTASLVSIVPSATKISSIASAPSSSTISTETPEVSSSLTLEDGCINSTTWTPDYGDFQSKDKNGCWQLLDLGISAQNGGLLLFLRQPEKDLSHGIFTPIPQNVVIEFTFQVNELETSSSARNTDIVFGIVPANEPDPFKGLVFLLDVQSKQQNPIFLKLDEPNQEPKLLRSQYDFGKEYKVKLDIEELIFNAIINGDNKIINTRSIPFADRAFWIGYTVPNGGTLSALISHITIQHK